MFSALIFASPLPDGLRDLLPPPLREGVGAVLLLVLLAILVLAALFLLVRRGRKGGPPARPVTKREEPPPPPEIKVELAPTESEIAKRRQAEEARQKVDELAQRREEARRTAVEVADAAERERRQAELAALKEREEEAKRDLYRAKKAAEQEAKDRRRREEEEQLHLRQLAEQRAKEAEEAKKRAAAEEERRKIEAQAGQTLAQGLDKTRNHGFIAKLNNLFGQSKPLDESVLAELEEILFTADIGVRTASRLVEAAREKLKRNEVASVDRLKSVIRTEVERMVNLPAPDSLQGGGPPHVVMVVGVNGSGKTTTIGKLAAKLGQSGKKVVLAAADTFRAAATEQLDIWAARAGAQLVTGADNSDPGAVVFEAVKRAKEQNADVVIADTAGRLHTKAPLMEELKKVRRVMDKALPGAPHEVILVLDATTGQNAIAQAGQFRDAVGTTSIVLTKLDGTAKGGVIIGICDELKIPVAWVGVGEKVADLRHFDAHEFVDALFNHERRPQA
jgi:fused signal recognition particle receptor